MTKIILIKLINNNSNVDYGDNLNDIEDKVYNFIGKFDEEEE